MFLSKEEEAILNGEMGEGYRKAMELLVALGDIRGADCFVEIKSAHVSGVSYLTIGDAGIELLKEWASNGVQTRVPTTTNPAGLDMESWQKLGFPKRFAEKQREILDAYARMGVKTSCTCIPYITNNMPTSGEHIAWAESNAVAYANSILGAMTNRESGISALAAALVGKVPRHGLHLEKNRRPTFEVIVEHELKDPFDYSAIGYYIGQEMEGIPLFNGVRPGLVEMKALGAALATGGVSMFHVKGITPAANLSDAKYERIHMGTTELQEAREQLNTADGAVDVICIGCPHCTVEEVVRVSKLKPRKQTWVFTSRYNKKALEGIRLHENVNVIYDTCMVVSPLRDIGIKSIGVNSAKAAFYASSLSGLDVTFAPLDEMVI